MFKVLGSVAKQPAHRTNLNGFLRNEDGISAIIFAICLPVFVATSALAIDMGYAYLKRTDLQTTASASSLAGAGTLMDDGIYDPVNDVILFATVDPDGDGVPNDPDSAVIFTEALLYAERNLPSEDVLAAVDLHAGNWEPTTRIFTSAGTWDSVTLSFTAASAAYDANTGTWTPVALPVIPLNSVLAVTRRAADGPNNNALPLFLAGAIGLPETNINTAAIATVGAKDPNGFNGCLMAMNDSEADSFLAFGTADISAFDCDIYINSSDECALSGNGNPLIEVGDALNPGMIYVVGESCSTNENVEWNCNLSTEAMAAGATCPKTNLSYAEQQVDPFEYTQLNSSMDTLKDLECGSQYDPDTVDYSNGTLEAYYSDPDRLGAAYDPAQHSGIGEFKVDSYVESELFEGVATTCGGGSGLLVDDGIDDGLNGYICQSAVVYPDDDEWIGGGTNPLVGTPIINGTKFVTDSVGWNWAWDELGDGTGRQEFTMAPGAYCGGINLRGNGTIVFEDGDYVMKGQAAAGANGGSDEFNLRGNTAIEGLNVAFYLADADIEINWGGSAQTDLIGRQETDDPMNGFLFYGDPSNEGPHQFRGTPAGGYQGIMYFPEGDVVFKGTADSGLEQADGEGLCSILIADTIYFNGTTSFNASADGCGNGFEIPPVGAQLVLRLVH